MQLSALVVPLAFLLGGMGGGLLVAAIPRDTAPLTCTIDPLLQTELEHMNAHMAHIAGLLDTWEQRQQGGLQEVARRRARLQQDALKPGQPTGLEGLPTRMEGQ